MCLTRRVSLACSRERLFPASLAQGGHAAGVYPRQTRDVVPARTPTRVHRKPSSNGDPAVWEGEGARAVAPSAGTACAPKRRPVRERLFPPTMGEVSAVDENLLPPPSGHPMCVVPCAARPRNRPLQHGSREVQGQGIIIDGRCCWIISHRLHPSPGPQAIASS
jgi:hypothetical protein